MSAYLEDLEAIRMLTHRYSHHLDRARLDDLVSLFTDDAVFDEIEVGLGRFEGIGRIRAFFEHDMGIMDRQVHYATNFILDVLEGDEARGSCYFLAQGTTRSGASVYATGYYEDSYRRTADGWKFSSRKVYPFLPPQLDGFELPEGET